MTGADITRRRQVLDLSLPALAELLNEHPDQLQQWEGIAGRLPGALERRLNWTLALEEREASLRSQGIVPCPERQRLELSAGPTPTNQQVEGLLAQIDTHTAGCPLCQRRQAAIEKLPPPPPVPLPGWVTTLGWIHDRIHRLPAPLRPPGEPSLSEPWWSRGA